ncbi:GNAT family N-acetyltransferase [Kiloniella laminariae]|uniref:Acyl-homoserine-lactone synthase n=1 Tax=Kiloniella laminariae TaxID=454162 RepID=A0ABT4LEF8_9PROT|nr:acyl-homoserine-lactone synthase [Kiloniella laminariae]MCZ4279479.1 GNAT family N-acetyltransferase [Kiloniella laminariae]
MFFQIDPQQHSNFKSQINSMFALRYRVFCERLGWVPGENQMERDSYDDQSPTYLIKQEGDGTVSACVRLLPSMGANMLRDTFPALLSGRACPASQDIMESSRFSVDTALLRSRGEAELSRTTYELFLAMIEFGLSRGLSKIITVTDLRMERLVKRANWPYERLGEPQRQIDGQKEIKAVAIAGEISVDALLAVREKAEFWEPVLFQPVVSSVFPENYKIAS